jgi:arylsulfatase A-like enzyme
MGNPGKKGYFAPYNSLPNLDLAVIGENLTDRLTTEAISFIESNKEKPFFLYLPFYAVHTPLMGKSELVQKYEKKGGRNGQDNPEFAAMVENVDMNIGRLLLLIDELKLRENTLIVITSDNGGIRAISHQDPLRAGKGSYYEGGVRVPYIVRWPAQIAADTINNSPIVNLDFFPTFMHLIGVSIENKVFDGKNITRLLMGEEMDKRPIFWHFPIYLQAYNSKKDQGRDPFFRTRPGSAVVYDNWKLHHYFEDDAIELYNLHDDLGEKNDLSEVHAEKAAELFELLNNWRVEVGAKIPNELNLNYDKNFENSKKRKQTKN